MSERSPNSFPNLSFELNESFVLPFFEKIFLEESAKAAAEPEILPRTLEEIIDLAEDVHVKPCFKEIQSMSLPNAYKRDLDPIFYLPGFKLLKAKKMLSKMAYPVFMARYPQDIKSLDDLASSLSQVSYV